jgi:hypothetical protein
MGREGVVCQSAFSHLDEAQAKAEWTYDLIIFPNVWSCFRSVKVAALGILESSSIFRLHSQL